MDELTHAKRVLEAVLLASHEPLPLEEIIKVFDPPVPTETVRLLLTELTAEWKARGSIEVVQVATGYRFQTRLEMQQHIDRLEPEKPPKYSRAVMETLAIIAYRQPATRGEIEAIRGVAVSTNILKALEDRGWVEVIGHKDTPGRPALFATTKTFLSDLALRSLSELPPLAELDPSPALELPEVPQEPVYPEQARIESAMQAAQTAAPGSSDAALFEDEQTLPLVLEPMGTNTASADAEVQTSEQEEPTSSFSTESDAVIVPADVLSNEADAVDDAPAVAPPTIH